MYGPPYIVGVGTYERPDSDAPISDRLVRHYEFDLFISGDGRITVDGTEYSVSRGLLMLKKPGQRCRSAGSYSCRTLELSFDPAFAPQSGEQSESGRASASPDASAPRPEPLSDCPAFRDAPCLMRASAVEVYDELFSDIRFLLDTEDFDGLARCVDELAHRVAADAIRFSNSSAEKRSQVHPSVSRAAAILSERYREKWTLESLARESGLNPHYLHSLFKAQLGATPLDYLRRVRVERACALLGDTSDPVERIAVQCGFSSPAYFSAAFRSSVGCSPRDYRSAV